MAQEPQGERTAMSRLPRWAQQRIEILERDLEHWKGEYQKILAERGFEEFEANYGVVPNTERMVLFPVDLDKRVYFEARLSGRELHVRGSQPVLISPRASNSIEISLEER